MKSWKQVDSAQDLLTEASARDQDRLEAEKRGLTAPEPPESPEPPEPPKPPERAQAPKTKKGDRWKLVKGRIAVPEFRIELKEAKQRLAAAEGELAETEVLHHENQR